MDIINTIFWATALLVITTVFLIIVVKFRKALAHSYSRLDNIPSRVYNSNRGTIEYLLIGDGPTILVSHGITGGVDQGIGFSEDCMHAWNDDGRRLTDIPILFIPVYGRYLME